MLISVKKRFIFVCNSKTASSSIERALINHAEINRGGSPKRKHIPYSEILQEYDFIFSKSGLEPDTFFKFGIIRDPLDWVRSWFNYLLDNPKVDNPLPAGTDFTDWWHSGKNWVKHRSQSRIFATDNGTCGMDVLIPLESLAEAMPKVLDKLRIEVATLPWANKSPGNMTTSEIAGQLSAEIRGHYAEDMELYRFWEQHWRDKLDTAGTKVGGSA